MTIQARWIGGCGALVLAVQPLAAGAAMIPIASDPISTSGGPIAGTQLASGVRAYLGIPYAAPPVGPLRWTAPQPIRWSGRWNADRRGPECIQVLRPHDINHYFGEEPTSEDCLYLNVWTPAKASAGARLPVIVFIYGGGFTIGSSGMPNYGGEETARAGAVFVNFNYRVGALGFMAHPELSREQGGHSGNYGLMDQTAALRWVRDNIARFGGDPAKVLLIGQSAGAGSVAAQIFSPAARGLFRAAVMSSGCNFASDGIGLAEAEKVGVEIQQRLGAAGLGDMRQIPADRILALQSENQVGAKVEGVRIGGPIVDGYVLPQPRKAALAAGAVARVPIIASYNSDDIDIGMNPIGGAHTAAEYRAGARALYGADADRFLALFPVSDDASVPAAARRVATMAGFEAGSRQCGQAQAALGQPVYIDEFTRRHPYVPGVRIADQDTATIGAYHTADMPYWFGTLDAYNGLRPTRNWTPWDRELSARMMQALIAMARTGNPSTARQPWPAWSSASERKIMWGDQVTVEGLDAAGLDFLAAHPIIRQALPRRPRD